MKNKLGKWEKVILGASFLLLVAPLTAFALFREFYRYGKYNGLSQRIQDIIAKTPGTKDLSLGEVAAKSLKLNGSLIGGAWVMLFFIVAFTLFITLGGARPMRRAEGISWLVVIFGAFGPMGLLAVMNGLNVSFATSMIFLVFSTGGVFLYGQRRPQGQPLTWGEAFAGAAIVFVILGLTYALVPNQFLQWADNELQWRKDKVGLPTPTGLPAFNKGINTMGFLGPGGRGRIIVTKETIRDLVVTNIYAAGLIGNFMMWAWWQRRNKMPSSALAVEPVSPFGRPLAKGA